MKGNTGKILHVDLTTGMFTVETPDQKFYRTYVGGSCMGVYYVTRLVPVGADPLGAENVLAFTTSAVVGAPLSGNARHCVSAKSPLTGGIMSSEGGGYWGPELKFAGFDAVVIRGKAPKPTYLWIHDGQVELRDASGLWGKLTGDVQDAVRQELADDKVRVLQIGPAGEKGVRFANLVNDLKHFNGRGGLGAVMGAKNLRVIAVRGTAKPDFDPAKLQALARAGAEKVARDGTWENFKALGTLQTVTDNQLITWTIYTPDDLVEIIRACTGWRYSSYELMLLGERRINLMRAFNAREGFTKADDTLPPRLFEDGLLDDGPTHGVAVDREDFLRAREEYYRLMGWDPATGNPTETKLRELSLDWVLA